MSAKVHVGVVGTSTYAEFMHFLSLRSHPQAELVAICGRNRERAEEMAAKYYVSKVFTDYKAMIHQGGLDAIIVAAPDDLHYEITMQALAAGLHVLCEKPLALTAQQAQEMYEEAEKVKVKHMVMFTYRWLPFFRYVHDLLDQGYIGRCYHGELRYLMGHGRNKEYRWRFDQKRANGTLADMGSHMIDLARWLVGDISRVNAKLSSFVDHQGADGVKIDPANDSAFLLAEFANSAQGMIHASSVTYGADRSMLQQVYLYGDAGSLEIDITYRGANVRALIRAAREGDEAFHTLDVPASYWGEVNPSEPFDVFTRQPVGTRSFIDAILSNSPVTPSFYDGYKAQQVIQAAMDSHRSGNWVAANDPA
jgi:predicted dehydrogenase